MKHKLLAILLGLAAINLHAQVQTITYVNGLVSVTQSTSNAETLDSAYLKCTYTLFFVKDANHPEAITEEDMLLFVGHKTSLFYSYSHFYNDSLIRSIPPEQLKDDASLFASLAKSGDLSYRLYKNLPAGSITTTDKIGAGVYRYEEPLEDIPWEISADTKTILGYACQKATASFHGRHYEAWFTIDIPVSEGPWKFTGLPGLILQVADADRHYVFECTGIEMPDGKIPIEMQQLNYNKVSKKEFNRVHARYRKNPVDFVVNELAATGTRLTMNIVNADGSPRSAEDLPTVPHNPIERE
jgi:GLPGLI family protein